MKIVHRLSFIALYVLIFNSCSDSNVKPRQGSISFSFSKKVRGIEGGRTGADTTAAAVLISISDSNDNPLIKDQKIPLVGFGSGYVLQNPIQLSVGRDKLKKFIVLNSANQAIYAAPVQGSPLASLVSNPLDINFDVTLNTVANVDVEVLPVLSSDAPSDFGFVTFSFHVVSRPPRLKDILNFDPSGTLSRQTFQYSGNTDIPGISLFYNCTDSAMTKCTFTGHWETVVDSASGKILSLKNFYENGDIERTISWLYNFNGTLKTMTSKAGVATGNGGAREDFYYKDNGQLSYSIWRRTADDIPNFSGYIRQYTYIDGESIGKIDTYYCTVFNGSVTTGEQYLSEEYKYDNHPANALTADLYWWAPFISPIPRKNNITSSKFTSYELVGSAGQVQAQVSDILEITRTYEYNEHGLPSKETVSVPGYNGFTNESDGAVKKYVYTF